VQTAIAILLWLVALLPVCLPSLSADLVLLPDVLVSGVVCRRVVEVGGRQLAEQVGLAAVERLHAAVTHVVAAASIVLTGEGVNKENKRREQKTKDPTEREATKGFGKGDTTAGVTTAATAPQASGMLK